MTRLHAATTLTLPSRTHGGPNAQSPCAYDRHDRLRSSGVAGGRPRSLRPLPTKAAPAPESFAAYEQGRLRAHFDSAERELRARDVPGLTPTQRVARARLLDILGS